MPFVSDKFWIGKSIVSGTQSSMLTHLKNIVHADVKDVLKFPARWKNLGDFYVSQNTITLNTDSDFIGAIQRITIPKDFDISNMNDNFLTHEEEGTLSIASQSQNLPHKCEN